MTAAKISEDFCNMKLITTYFPSPAGGDMYGRMLRALRNSVAANCPTQPLEVIDPTEMSLPTGIGSGAANSNARLSFQCNTAKMRLWESVVADAEDGECLALIDADVIVLRPLADVFSAEFDLAMTWRPEGAKFPFNSGVVFVRVNDRTREFFAEWRRVNDEFLADGERHQQFRARYGGINQAALGAMLESDLAANLNILKLDCEEWNCEDSTWALANDATRVVHIKGRLRKAIFRGGPRDAATAPLVDLWEHYERSTEPRAIHPRPVSPFPSRSARHRAAAAIPRRRERWHTILDRLPTGVPLAGVEIGVWHGENAAALLAARPDLSLTLIDPYRCGKPGTPWWESGSTMPSRPQADYDAAMAAATARLAQFGDRAAMLRCDGAGAAAAFDDESLDLVWIDGDHSYEGCLADIEAWLPKVRAGGLIGGHDYGREQRGAVAAAVHDIFEDDAVEIAEGGTWFVRM